MAHAAPAASKVRFADDGPARFSGGAAYSQDQLGGSLILLLLVFACRPPLLLFLQPFCMQGSSRYLNFTTTSTVWWLGVLFYLTPACVQTDFPTMWETAAQDQLLVLLGRLLTLCAVLATPALDQVSTDFHNALARSPEMAVAVAAIKVRWLLVHVAVALCKRVELLCAAACACCCGVQTH